ncbi:MAG: hypothetical protein K6D02_03750 [Lachnospiraceae bacterium]|nr:hypothetical protein [Lachnospiraceae bacterium]
MNDNNKPKVDFNLGFTFGIFDAICGLILMVMALSWEEVGGGFMLLGLFCLIFGIAYIIYGVSIKNKYEQAQSEQKEKKRMEEEKEKGIELYKTCNERGIKGSITNSNIESIKLIASNLGIQQGEEEYYYNLGKEEEGRKIIEKNKEQQKRLLDNKKLAYDKLLNLASKIGKDKYYKDIIEKYEALKSAKKVENYMSGFHAHKALNYEEKPTQINSSIMGGIADGIGGTGAGMAAYMDAERENAEERMRAAERTAKERQRSYEEYKRSKDNIAMIDKKIKELKEKVDYLKPKMCDMSNPEEKMKMLTFEKVTVKSDIAPFLRFNGFIDFDGKPTVLGNEARLDGIFKIVVRDPDNSEIIGVGYYCPPGENEGTDLRKVGFKYGGIKFETMGKMYDGKIFDEYKEYKVDIFPMYLWTIEI